MKPGSPTRRADLLGMPRPSILAVDDREDGLIALRTILEGVDASVVTASSGNEALSKAYESNFAAILLDVRMPDISGFEVARVIRGRHHEVPIIFVTAAELSPETISEACSLGAADFVSKPFSAELLRSKVRSFVELFVLRARLEQEVRRRTLELEEMEAFSHAMAHNLGAPLRSMNRYSELLIEEYQAGPLDDAGRRYLRRISRAAMKMDRLLQGLLIYGRLGRTEPRLQPLDPRKVIARVLQRVDPLLAKARARVHVAQELPLVIADGEMMEQALTPLIHNAITYVSPGETPSIDIRADRSHGRVRISIRDNGIGIPEDFHARVFNVFERRTAAEEDEGTGIGLAIAKRAVERMKGHLTLQSAVGTGSTFIIALEEASG
jgi:two-component system, sensor histidine kinase and response regulator